MAVYFSKMADTMIWPKSVYEINKAFDVIHNTT